MINVEIMCSKGETYGFTCNGHAKYDEYGQDIVCSAVSAITQTCVLGLTNVVKIIAGISMDEEGGIVCTLDRDTPKEKLEQAQLLFDTLVQGLSSIESEYPNTLNIIHREV